MFLLRPVYLVHLVCLVSPVRLVAMHSANETNHMNQINPANCFVGLRFVLFPVEQHQADDARNDCQQPHPRQSIHGSPPSLVYLVRLVCLVFLVEPDKRNKPEKPIKHSCSPRAAPR
jgi:hypothetical protein